MKKKVIKAAKPKAKPFDWETLARRLQEALAKEMKENEGMAKELERVTTELVQASGIILYLEKRLGNHQV